MAIDAAESGAWDALGAFLSGQALPVYIALLVLFAALELLLQAGQANQRAQEAAPGIHSSSRR